MRSLIVTILFILSYTASAQLPLYQLEYAPDSNYVVGALENGEPIWVLKKVGVDSVFMDDYDIYYIKNGDTTYVGNVTDSTYVGGLTDSIYIQGDSLIMLRDGSGDVYVSRIYDFDVHGTWENIGNPQVGDVWIADQYDSNEKSKYYTGSRWETFDHDSHVGNEGVLSLATHMSVYNAVKLRSTGLGSGSEISVLGDTLIRVTYDDIVPILRLNMDTLRLYNIINQIVSDTFSLDMDIDSTNEIQVIDTFALSNDTLKISLIRDGLPFNFVELPEYVDSVYLDNFDLYYVKDGDNVFVGNLTDSTFVSGSVDSIYDISTGMDGNDRLILLRDGEGSVNYDPSSLNEMQYIYRNGDTLYLSQVGAPTELIRALVPTGGSAGQIIIRNPTGDDYDWYDNKRVDSVYILRDKYWESGLGFSDSIGCNVWVVQGYLNNTFYLVPISVCSYTDTSLIQQIVSDTFALDLDIDSTNEIQVIDTFALDDDVLKISLSKDGQPYKYVTLPKYVDSVFLETYDLYYIKDGDTIFVGNIIDSSFIYNVVSDTFALDMDIDSTNELQALFHQDNILVLYGAGPETQVDLTPYMDVDSIYMNDYDLWYTKSAETGTPRFVGNVTDSNYILSVVSDSIAAIDFPSDSTTVSDTPTLDLTMTGKDISGRVDTTLIGTKYDISQKQNLITGATGQTLRFSGTNTLAANSLLYNDGTNIGIGTTSPTHPLSIAASSTADNALFQAFTYPAAPSAYNLTMKQTVTGGVVRYNYEMVNNSTSYPNMFVFDRGNVGFGVVNPAYRIDTDSDIQVNGARIGLGGGSQATNVAFGASALAANTSGTLNVAIGQGALASANLSLNTAIGWYAMSSRTSGTNNLAIGSQSMRYANTGNANVGIGPLSLVNVTGSENVAIGANTGYNMTSSDYNTLVGKDAGASLTTGDNNTYIGRYAGGYNSTGSGNIAIGNFSAYLSTASNRLSIENTTITSPLIGGQFDNNRVGINTDLESITDALHVTGNIRGTAAYIDATNSPGTSGQVLSSTITGTDWIDLPTATGDIEAVTVTAPILGGGTSGSVNIAIDTTDATATAVATQYDMSQKQAILVSGTNIKTVNSNSLLGSGDVSVGTVQSITVNAPLTTTQAPIITTATLGVDTTAATPSALATQHDISTKIGALGAIGSTPNANAATISGATLNLEPASASFGGVVTTGTQTFGGSKTFNYLGGSEGTNVTTGTSLVMADVNGKLENLYGSTGTNDLPLYDGTKWLLTKLKTVNGTSLLGAGDLTTSTYAFWRISANGGTAFAVTDNTLVDFNNSTGITWTRDAFTGEMTATLADNSATNELQSLSAPSWNTGTGVLTTGISGGSGTTIDLDGRYLTAEVDGSTTNEIQNLSYNTSTRALGISSGTGVTLPLVTSTMPGLVSAYPNNTTSFLRGDGTWATPPTPAVTGTAPIVVTSGNISLNIGTGLYNSSGSLTNLSTNYGYLFHSSGTIGGQSISTTPLTVNFNDQMQGFNMTCNTTSDYVQVTNSGGYEIDYGICVGGISSTRQISVQVYVGSSSVPGTLKRFFIDSGDEDCTLGKHVMDLTAGQQVFLKVATSGAETATFDGPQLKVTRIY